jgi:hypothetical protein
MLESHRALDAAPEFSDSPAYRLDAPSPTRRALEADLDAVVHAIVSARKDAEALSPFRHARTRTATPGASASRRDEEKWSWSARAAALEAELTRGASPRVPSPVLRLDPPSFRITASPSPSPSAPASKPAARTTPSSLRPASSSASPVAPSAGEAARLRAELERVTATLAEERAARFFPAADADREAETATLRSRAAEAERRAEKVRVALEEMVRAAAAATDALVESSGEPRDAR